MKMKDQTVINIAIADQHPIYRYGLINIIHSMDEFRLVFDVSNGPDLIDKLKDAEVFPDICIIDLSKNEVDNYDIIRQIKKRWIGLRILALSVFNSEFSIIRMINLGVNGFLSKGCEPEEIRTALISLYNKD